MKSISYFPLYHSKFKYLGLVLCLVGLVLFLLINPQYQMLSYIGLLIAVFSKESVESEIIESIRAEVFKTVFGFTISLTIALYITEGLSKSFTFYVTPFLIVGLPLLLYLLIFNLTLAFKIKVDSSHDLATNFKNHRHLYLVWIVIILAITSVLVLRIYLQQA